MRTLFATVPVALALGLSACASDATNDRYTSDLRQLADDCRARGGILAPTGQQSGRPQVDNVCEIRGQPARAPHTPG